MKRQWPKQGGDPGVPKTCITVTYKYAIVHEMRHAYQHCKNSAADAAGNPLPFPGPIQECDAMRQELKWGKEWPVVDQEKKKEGIIPKGSYQFDGRRF